MQIRLRAWLIEHPAASLHDAARAMRRSTRQLQQELALLETTFVEERWYARIECAKQLLAADHKVEAVARDVGFRSVSHFSRVFRRITGVAPGETRRCRR